MASPNDGSSEIVPIGDEAPQWDLFRILDKSGIPFSVVRNAVVAITKGVSGIVVAAADVPTAHLQAVSTGIRDRTAGRSAVAKAAAKAAAKAFSADDALAQRAIEYFGAQIRSEQENREAIAKGAVHELRDAAPSAEVEHEIDTDWLTAFWRLAESKSRPEVQSLMSRILAGEITKPGSVSPQTLQVLSVLTTDVAQQFERFCNLSIEDCTSTYVLHPNVGAFQNTGPLDEYGVSFVDLHVLDGMRLIQSAETTLLTYQTTTPPDFEDINYAGLPGRMSVSGMQLHFLFLTPAGRELRRFIKLSPVKAYTLALKQKLGEQLQIPVDA